MAKQELCDDILKLHLTNVTLMPNFSLQQMFSANGIAPEELNGILRYLSGNPPAYLSNTSGRYILTAAGEDFIKNGGFAGKAKRDAEEKLAKEQERELIRLVNQSVLDTNQSVRVTHIFQKRSTQAMIVVAASSLVISIISLMISVTKSSTESQLQQHLSAQKMIDSLRVQLKEATSTDSLRKKSPQ